MPFDSYEQQKAVMACLRAHGQLYDRLNESHYHLCPKYNVKPTERQKRIDWERQNKDKIDQAVNKEIAEYKEKEKNDLENEINKILNGQETQRYNIKKYGSKSQMFKELIRDSRQTGIGFDTILILERKQQQAEKVRLSNQRRRKRRKERRKEHICHASTDSLESFCRIP